MSIEVVEPKVSDDGPCPKCGGKTIFGFGLRGGGYGPYRLCDDEKCNFFIKEQEKTEEEAT